MYKFLNLKTKGVFLEFICISILQHFVLCRGCVLQVVINAGNMTWRDNNYAWQTCRWWSAPSSGKAYIQAVLHVQAILEAMTEP